MLGKFESYGIRGRDTEQKPVSEIKESLYPRGISEQRKVEEYFFMLFNHAILIQ